MSPEPLPEAEAGGQAAAQALIGGEHVPRALALPDQLPSHPAAVGCGHEGAGQGHGGRVQVQGLVPEVRGVEERVPRAQRGLVAGDSPGQREAAVLGPEEVHVPREVHPRGLGGRAQVPLLAASEA